MLPFMHALFNPVVYFIMSRTFRQSAMKKFRQWFCKQKRCDDASPSKKAAQTQMKIEDIPVSNFLGSTDIAIGIK